MFVGYKKTVSGSTIIEVVTAFSLIALGVALTLVVFSKTMESSNLYVKHKAVNGVNEMIAEQSKAMNYRPHEVDSADIRIISTVAPLPGHDSLQIVTYSASLQSSGKQLYARRLIKKIHAN